MKKKTGPFSIISVLIVVAFYAMGILALVGHEIALNTMKSDWDVFDFWQHKIWDVLAPIISMGGILGAIPFLIFNIIGIVVEKKALPFVLCIFLPAIIWLFVTATAIAYF